MLTITAAEVGELQEALKSDTLQPPYHLFRREIDAKTLPYSRDHGIGVMGSSPLAHGLLTGKLDTDTEFAEDDWRGQSDVFRGEEFEGNVQIVKELARFADERGWTVAQLAVAWTLSSPGVDVAIVGARRPDQIEGTAPAGDLEVTSEDRAEIDEIMEGATAVGGPSPEAV